MESYKFSVNFTVEVEASGMMNTELGAKDGVLNFLPQIIKALNSKSEVISISVAEDAVQSLVDKED